MSRRGQGPRLVFLEKRACWYVRWTDGGRTRERSCATANRDEADVIFAQFLADHVAKRAGCAGPRDPARFPVADALAAYATEHAPSTDAPARIGYAIKALATFWSGNVVADITRETCRAYQRQRGVADGTVRRELTVLRAAINHAVKEGRLTRAPHVWLPEPPAPRDRWLTRKEAAALLRATRHD